MQGSTEAAQNSTKHSIGNSPLFYLYFISVGKYQSFQDSKLNGVVAQSNLLDS